MHLRRDLIVVGLEPGTNRLAYSHTIIYEKTRQCEKYKRVSEIPTIPNIPQIPDIPNSPDTPSISKIPKLEEPSSRILELQNVVSCLLYFRTVLTCKIPKIQQIHELDERCPGVLDFRAFGIP